MTNPADHSAADGAPTRHTLTVQEASPSSPHPEPEQSPAGGELEPAAVLRLFAYGWTVIESDGASMTIQAPDDSDPADLPGGETELVIDLARQAPAPSGREEREAVELFVREQFKRLLWAVGYGDQDAVNVLGCRTARSQIEATTKAILSRQAASAAGGGE